MFWLGFKIVMFGRFQEMRLVVKILKRHLSYVVEVMITAWSVGLTSSSLAQVDSHLENEVIPEEVCPYQWQHPV